MNCEYSVSLALCVPGAWVLVIIQQPYCRSLCILLSPIHTKMPKTFSSSYWFGSFIVELIFLGLKRRGTAKQTTGKFNKLWGIFIARHSLPLMRICAASSSRGKQINRRFHVNADDDGTLGCNAAEMRFGGGGVVSISVIDDVGLPPQAL